MSDSTEQRGTVERAIDRLKATWQTDNRQPPTPLANNRTNNTDSWCRYDPMVCMIQVWAEAVFIVLAYGTALYVLGGADSFPGLAASAKFMALFTVLSFTARMVSDSLGDKMGISAVSALSAKVLTTLAPRIASW